MASSWRGVVLVAVVVPSACGPEIDATDPDAFVLAVRTSNRLELHSIDAQQQRQLVPGPPFDPPIWTPDGRELVIATSDGLLLHDVASDETRSATWDRRRVDQPALNSLGDRVVATYGDRDAQGVALIDLVTGDVQELSPATSGDLAPRWSPRGDQLAFHRVFSEWIAEPTMAMLVDVGPEGAREPIRLTDTPEEDLQSEWVRWSYDGSWRLLAEGHPWHYHRLTATAETTEIVVVDGEGIAHLAMSPSANRLFLAVDLGGSTYDFRESLHDLDTGTTIVFPDDHGAAFWEASSWSPSRDEIAYASRTASGVVIRLLDLPSGLSQELARLADDDQCYALSFSPDGESIAASLQRFDPEVARLVVVDRANRDVDSVLERANDKFLRLAWRPHTHTTE